MATAMTRAVPKVLLIPLRSIVESASNPRKTFTGIEELAADVGLRGILQPILLRENGKGYELVFGARRFRAAKLAGLPDIPAFIRELSDEEVLEIQLVENSKRADIHPLEEADGYRRLHEDFRHSIEEIAAKVGKSRTAIYERIKLCALIPAAREAFFDGKLSASTALLVARIPDKELQAKAVKDLLGTTFHRDEPMSYREAVEHVHSHYMLQLKDAPFSTTDADLVPKAGPCSACPKRTGNQRELFADVKSADVCTDPPCYRSKTDAVWQLRVARAKESGQRVITGAAAKEIFPYGEQLHSSDLKRMDGQEWVNGKFRTVKSLLGKDAAPTAIARTPSGAIVELVSASTVQRKVREVEPTPSTTRYSHNDDNRQQEKKYQLRRQVVAAAMPKIIEKAESGVAGLWVFLANAVFHGGYHGALTDVARRRGFSKDKKKQPLELLEAALPKMTEEQLRGLVVEVVATADAAGGSWSYSYAGVFLEACKTFRVDVKKIEAGVKAAKKPSTSRKAART